MNGTSNFQFYFIIFGIFVLITNSFLQLFGDTENIYIIIFSWLTYAYPIVALVFTLIETKHKKSENNSNLVLLYKVLLFCVYFKIR